MRIEPIKLTGEHAVLEPLSRGHLGPMAAVLDPKLLQWFPKPVTNDSELADFIEEALHAQDAGTALPFATIERATNKVVGSTRFANIDRANRRLEIGWTWIGRPWQRTAINTEAKLLMLTHAFETLGAIRVEFKTDSLNRQSRAALTRLGAVEEGTFRNHMITASGRIRHSVWFSIVDSEWIKAKRRLEERLAQNKTVDA
ncbi:MAG TPA: GNAT family protein [Alphaproteobacteria bacterium]|nr:GNAT family protein [Alphaproteobacteria bacterium]